MRTKVEGVWKGGGTLSNPKGIIIHAMSSELEGKPAPEWLMSYGLSAHAFIDKSGNIYDGMPIDRIAYHAGQSRYESMTNLNLLFLGIELMIDSNGYADFIEKLKDPKSFTEAHYKSTVELCSEWMRAKPSIKIQYILGHRDVSGHAVRGVGKGKLDPGEFDLARVKYQVLNLNK